MKRTRSALRHWTISIVLALVLAAATNVPSSGRPSDASVSDSVYVSRNDLNNLTAGVDTLLLERRLLQIDLTEARRMAQVDSLMYEDRLDIYRSREGSWLTRALSHPAIWFMIGAYAGLQAAR